MTLPGLLIEYLVSGALALAWLHPYLPKVAALQAWHAPFAAGALYVIGMAIDLVAFATLRWPKFRVRVAVARRIGLAPALAESSGTARLAFIQKTSPTIAAEVTARSSRDRIARGTFVNAVIATAVGIPGMPRPILALVAAVALVLWLFSESQSHLYELRAAQVLGYEPKSI